MKAKIRLVWIFHERHEAGLPTRCRLGVLPLHFHKTFATSVGACFSTSVIDFTTKIYIRPFYFQHNHFLSWHFHLRQPLPSYSTLSSSTTLSSTLTPCLGVPFHCQHLCNRKGDQILTLWAMARDGGICGRWIEVY